MLRRRFLKTIFFMGMITASVYGHGASPDGNASNEPIARKTGRTLILTTGYYDPNIDTVGFNKLTENVTQAFSSRLSPILIAANKAAINVNDKSTKYSAGESLALHATKNDADSAVILSIDTPSKNGQLSIHLQVQYVNLLYLIKDGVPYSVIPANELKRSYYLRGPNGDSPLSISDLANQFAADLKAAGHLQ